MAYYRIPPQPQRYSAPTLDLSAIVKMLSAMLIVKQLLE